MNSLSDFEEMHIKLTFKELNERFGFDLKFWNKKFYDALKEQPRSVDERGYFLRWGNDNVNPLLNQILGRRTLHDTFNKFVLYVMNKQR